ncbi:DsbC family protein [Permianibacter sp. IMCC34836]|uniref:DsbC family protein n=1 Tax=Permianibacter fluminis TaxID=2738515 RepID=UPI0015582C6D|nr:DsbC family protein [Permianibacter fluminis]NQD37339.1 DsbC family protein [Permianibacter fluminis]
MTVRLAALLLVFAPLLQAAEKPAVTKAAVAKPSIEARLKATLEAKFPDISVDMVRKSAYAGLYEAAMGDDVVYLSPDGKFLIFGGTMLGIEAQPINLTQMTKAEFDAQRAPMRAAELAKVDKKSMLTFTAPNQKYEINVFTDIDCGYCQKLHKDMPELNRLGITVHYLGFPRAGLLDDAGHKTDSYQKLINVWCAEDPKKAMTAAKNRQILPDRDCKNSLAEHYALTRKFGLSGTPAIVLNDGSLVGGYLPPAQMLQALQQGDVRVPSTKVSATN